MTIQPVLSRALEAAWGIRYKPITGSLVRLNRPDGFIVAERRLRVEREGEWILYWARKEGISSKRLASLISRETGGEARILGLKDTDSISYQYVFVRGAAKRPERIEGEGFNAWLIGRRTRGPKLGVHGWNNFRVEVTIVEGDPRSVCGAAGGLVVPGFYGPQRFGVERPNTHLYGLLAGIPAPGLLVREYRYWYPMQPPYHGGYEERALEEMREEGDPYRVLNHTPQSIARDALESYIWNRMLSRVLEEGVPPRVYERESRALCPVERKAWLAHLPSRRLLSKSGRWSSLLWEVLEEEAIPARLLPAKAPMRPVAVEACRSSCRVEGGRIILWLTLPRGLYATMAVRSLAYVDWAVSKI